MQTEPEMLEAYFTNPSVHAMDLEYLFKRSRPFGEMTDQLYVQLVIYALQNPRLHKTREAERYDFAAVEPFLDIENDDAVKAAWNILQIVSPTTEWASVFAQCRGNLHYAGPPQTNEYRAALISGDQKERAKLEEIRATDELKFFREAFNRWREKSENDLSYFSYTRRNIAAAAARTDRGIFSKSAKATR